MLGGVGAGACVAERNAIDVPAAASTKTSYKGHSNTRYKYLIFLDVRSRNIYTHISRYTYNYVHM